MSIKVLINNQETVVQEATAIEGLLGSQSKEKYLDVWVGHLKGSSLTALINGERGWLLWINEKYPAGFGSRNPHYTGLLEAKIESREGTFPAACSEGIKKDEYPANWAIPRGEIALALHYFCKTGERTPDVHWHNQESAG